MGFGGFLGFLLQIGLIVLAVQLVGPLVPPSPIAGVRWRTEHLRPRRRSRTRPDGRFRRTGGPAADPDRAEQDYKAFEQLLQNIQAAWSRHDLNALRSMVTPEMLSYFNEQLADQASHGARNEVSDVRLLQGDLAQAWREGAANTPRWRCGSR